MVISQIEIRLKYLFSKFDVNICYNKLNVTSCYYFNIILNT